MRDMILNTDILPEPLVGLISTEKIRVREAGGVIKLIPLVEQDPGCPLWGVAAESSLTVDRFMAMKREEKELER